jgi:hypothetical protein
MPVFADLHLCNEEQNPNPDSEYGFVPDPNC